MKCDGRTCDSLQCYTCPPACSRSCPLNRTCSCWAMCCAHSWACLHLGTHGRCMVASACACLLTAEQLPEVLGHRLPSAFVGLLKLIVLLQ